MTDRDDELARRLGGVRPPDHGPHFWASLRQGLANSTGHGSGAEPGFVENEDRPNSTDQGSGAEPHFVENEGVVELAERRERRRIVPGSMVAAAVALVALVSTALVLSADRDTDVATDPTVVEPSPETTLDEEVTTTTDPVAGPLRAEGAPIERGVGRPVAVDPAGTFLYVAAPAPDGGLGCEGAPAEALYVERVDGDGSDRRLAADPALVDATGGIEVRFSAGGEIAVVPRCEGFGNRVLTGRVAGDGTVNDLTELALRDIDLERDVDGIADLEFAGPGVLLAATWSVADDGSEHRHLYEFPTGPSEISDLGVDGVVAIDVLADGRLVTASIDGSIRIDGQVVAEVPQPSDLVASPSGRTIVVDGTGGGGLTAVDPVTGTVSPIAIPDVADIELIDDRTLVFTYGEGAGFVVASFDLVSGEQRNLAPSATGRFVVAASASAVFTPGSPTAPGAVSSVIEQRLTR